MIKRDIDVLKNRPNWSIAQFLWLLLGDQGIVSIQNWAKMEGVYLCENHHKSKPIYQDGIQDDFAELVNFVRESVDSGEIETADVRMDFQEWRRQEWRRQEWRRWIKKESALNWVLVYKDKIWPLRHFPKDETDHLANFVKKMSNSQGRDLLYEFSVELRKRTATDYELTQRMEAARQLTEKTILPTLKTQRTLSPNTAKAKMNCLRGKAIKFAREFYSNDENSEITAKEFLNLPGVKQLMRESGLGKEDWPKTNTVSGWISEATETVGIKRLTGRPTKKT